VLDNISVNFINFHIVSGTGDVATNNFANGTRFNPAPPNGIVTNTVITTNQFWTPDGQQIILNAGLEPAFAWLKSEYFVNDDEPAFDVVPSDWKAGANAGEYSKDNHYTKIDGQAVQYSFTAAGITWIGEMNVDESNVDVYLDGNYQQTVNCWSSTRVTQARMFSATNLAAGPHTLKLVKRGGTYMIVDALAVTPTNFWLTSTPNSGSVTPSITFSNMIKLDTFGGYTDTTTLSAVTLPFGLPLPAGMTANFNPPTLTGAGFSVLTITASNNTPAGNYELAITGTGGGVTNLVAVNLTVSGTSVQAPIITSQPASLTNYPGTLATFAVVATGSPASYQWRKNGANLADGGNVSGSTGAILNLGNVSSNDAANYSVILNNSAGSVTSSVVTLTVTGNAPSAPVANFTVSPTNGIRPLAVTFIDTSAGSITNLLWNFGDSQTTNTAAGAVVAHTYKTNGTYTVSLVASGSGGSSTNTQLNSVTVLVPNPPHISGISSFSGNALVLQGSGGPTNGGYYYWLRSSTNITLPLANWNVVATNPFDVYGNFSNQIPLMPGTPQTFYRLQMP
jgi:PKD repeat protein